MSVLLSSIFYSVVTIILNYLLHITSNTPIPETIFQLSLVLAVYSLVFYVALSLNKD